ncbi:MAG: hypothetical protein KBT47_01705, partial [Armatimonadetes bacterium]|nr:hypothetical protein [Candidatus Hippobium faecium]
PENGELYTDRSEYNYGVKLKFGDFGISGNVYETINEADFKDSQKYDFGVSAGLFGGSLTGTVIFSNAFGAMDNFYRQYKLGYTKNIGQRFSLSLSGEYDERNTDHQGFNKEDLKGNLSMGISF